MRLLLLLLLSFALPLAGTAQVKNELTRQKLKGRIKTVTEYEYGAVAVSGEAIKDTLRRKSISSYNEQGNETEFVTYSPAGNLLSRSVYNYNDSGHLIDVKRFRADGSLNVTTKYRYDARGNQEEDFNTDPSGTLFMRGVGKYDGKGNRIVYDRFNQYGILFLKSNFKFDKSGNEIEEREYDSHQGLKYTTTYEYGNHDRHGNWLYRVTLKNDEPKTITEREITLY